MKLNRLCLVFALSLLANAAEGRQPRGLASGQLADVPVLALDRAAANATETGEAGFTVALHMDAEQQLASRGEEEGSRSLLLRVSSEGAAALRVHFNKVRLPQDSRLFVYSLATDGSIADVAGPYTGAGPLRTGEFWSGAVRGDHAIIEVQFDKDALGNLPFDVDALSHLLEVPAPEALPELAADADTRTSLFRGMVVEHQVENGLAVLEGDILLGPADELPAASGKVSSREAIAATSTYSRWPNGVIPYVIDPAMPSQSRVTAAVAEWNTKLAGVIRMVPRTNERDYLYFHHNLSSGKCSSYIGKYSGQQYLELGSSCSTGNAIHEIGHAVGLYHEQSREDRNRKVAILSENLTLSAMYNFTQAPYASDDLVYYDYGSIMHYAATAFSSNGRPTIATIPAGIPIGQRTTLSSGDIAAVMQMYGKPNSGAPSGKVRVTLTTVPAGRALTVDGAATATPFTAFWTPGSVHTVSAPATFPMGSSRAYRLVGWTNNGPATQTLTVGSTPQTLAALYSEENLLNVTSSTGGTATVSPESPTRMYADMTTVSLTAAPQAGYCFSSWTGFSAGTASEISLTISDGRSVTANFIPGAITPAAVLVTVPKAGGSVPVTATASTGCGWMVKSQASFVTITRPFATSASPTTTLSVAANPGTTPRVGTITVAGVPVIVTQLGQ